MFGAVGCGSGSGTSHGPDSEPDSSVSSEGNGADAAQPSDDDDVPQADAGTKGELDGGTDAALPPLPEPDWDASVSGPPVGLTYVEVKGSFALKQPAALATAYSFLITDTGNVRLFLNAVEQTDAGTEVRYGSVFLETSGPVFQYPSEAGSFRATPSQDDPQTFVSEPFDYQLHAWVPSSPGADTGYELQLSATQTVWAAHFDSSFEHIDQGSLNGIVLRSEAEKAPLELDSLSCLGVCQGDFAFCSSHGVSTLADLLDCSDAKLDADANADGTNDGYRLRITFESESVPSGT